MLKGYNGRIVRVDLTTGNIENEPINEDLARKFIGGIGYAAKILWEETTEQTDPMAPESPLIFMMGPLTGSPIPSSSRSILAGISPATGIWGQSHSGGSFADELRHGGFDGIVIKGQARGPVYLWLHDGQVEIRDASHLWGKNTYEAAELLQKETDSRASPACIGRAGERLVKFAGIMTDGKHGRAAARCGLGALMGSKRLKAVVARGTRALPFHDEEKLKEGAKKVLSLFPLRKPEVASEAHVNQFKNFFKYGRVPVRNFSRGTFDAGLAYTEDLRNAKPLYCRHCPYDCAESYQTQGGERHMVWEAWGPLGTNCLIVDPEALQEAYTLCNQYGMDAISIGAVMSFAMECFEKGLITKSDTDGLDLRWGNAKAMLEMVRRIGEREGIGDLLAEGVKRAAERIGGLAHEYAMHVKGMELPAHEPRTAAGLSLLYAVGSIGAAHMESPQAQRLENCYEEANPRTSAELGYPVVTLSRFETKGKGALIARTQDFGCLLDAMTICLFLSVHQWVQPSHYTEFINAATGWDMDLQEFLFVGERISNLKRMFSVRRGISRKDDTLPPRVLTLKLEGGTRGHLPFLGEMLNDYYAHRGWSEEGVPTREKLTRLGLEECMDWSPR
jgi:aldehyde:ferredoxin oxidoreductase